MSSSVTHATVCGYWLCLVAACSRVDVYAVTLAAEGGSPLPSSDSITTDETSSDGAASSPDVSSSAATETSESETSETETSETETSGTETSESETSETTEADAGPTNVEPPSAGCLEPPLRAGDTDVMLQVGTTSRNYVLHVPEAYVGNTAVPMIVDFHGIGASGRSELESSLFPAVTDPEGVIMAFPDGLPGPLGSAWNFGPCCVADVDDLAFTRALVDDVRRRACIEPARIYAVGVLTGGGMVQHLACEAADIFAAIAPAAFDLLEETAPDCVPAHPISVMAFRGTEDNRVPYEGGPSSVVPGMPITFLGAQRSVERWAEINQCSGTLSAEDDRGCASYSGCADGVDVALCTDHGGGEAPADAQLAWPVLSRHRR